MQRNNWKYLLTSILEYGIFLANKAHTQATHISIKQLIGELRAAG